MGAHPSKMNTKRSVLESQDYSQNMRSKTRTKKPSFSNSILGSVSNDFTRYDEKKQCLKRMVKDSYTTKGNYICKTANKNSNDYRINDSKNITKKAQIWRKGLKTKTHRTNSQISPAVLP